MKSDIMTRPISGTWLDFQHGLPEGKYFDPACAAFTAEQWSGKITEIAGLGMEYLVLMGVARFGKSFYPSRIIPQHRLGCDDPLDAVFSAADRHNLKIFVSNGFFGPEHQAGNPDGIRLSLAAMDELTVRYGHHRSFYGWYFPNEARIEPYYTEDYLAETAVFTARARELDRTRKTLIAPYGTNWVKVDDHFTRQLEKLDVDIVAYQDEVGVQRGTPETTGAFYKALRQAHDKVSRAALWADMEVFTFEGDVYKSALLPAPFSRVEQQMEMVSPHVDTILIYQYQGMMNKPASAAFAGHPDSTRLYSDYRKWLEKQYPEIAGGNG